MKVEWSIIGRIKSYIGKINYGMYYGNHFEQLLDVNNFEDASNMLDIENIKYENLLKKMKYHIKSHEYVC